VLSSQVGGAGRSSFQGGARAPTGGALEVLPEAGVGGSGSGDGRRRWSGRSGGAPSGSPPGAPMAASSSMATRDTSALLVAATCTARFRQCRTTSMLIE
jgi:hypothetical protein